MIYTVTLNPAVDYVLRVDSLTLGKTNRSHTETLSFGGKGINVSRILHTLGIPTTAMGFVAGFTGQALERSLSEAGIPTDLVHLREGATRINVKLKAECETEINAAGPAVPSDAAESLLSKLDRLRAGDTLVLAGSVPPSLPADIYMKILERLSGRGIRFVIDAERSLLTDCLCYKPFLIKPNRQELSDITGQELVSEKDVEQAARQLRERGAINVLVSLGKDGALLVDEHGTLRHAPAVGGAPINTVGAGDSMVAGFLAGVDKGYAHALYLGSAAGGATACSEGLATAQKIRELMQILTTQHHKRR